MRKIVLTLAVAAAAFSLSACGAIDLTKGNDNAPAAPAAAGNGAVESPAPETPAAKASSAPAGKVIGARVAQLPTLGKVVTDWQGWTLYRFDKDAPKPSKATCAGDCATKWPHAPWVEGMKIEGVDQKVIGKVARADGALQLTINGWPAYRYSGDAKPGEAKGQGSGGTWYALTPEGKKAQAQTTAAGGGY
jgi:predicted lipoprotein with Yx(FWY)xxD motif